MRRIVETLRTGLQNPSGLGIMSESDSHYVFSHPSLGWAGLPRQQHLGFGYLCFRVSSLWLMSAYLILFPGTQWVSQVPVISLYTCHALQHRQILQNLTNAILLYRLPFKP